MRRYHDDLDGYTCVFTGCNRRYSSLKSYREHINKVHKDLNEMCRENSSIQENHPSTSYEGQHLNIIPEEQNEPVQKEKEVLILPQALVDVDTICKSMNKSCMCLMLKWLSKDSLPRKTAFEMQSDILNSVIDPLTSVIDDMCGAGMMTVECKNTIAQLLNTFDVKTEYSFLKRLENEGLYSPPVLFSISEELRPAVLNSEQQMVISMLL